MLHFKQAKNLIRHPYMIEPYFENILDEIVTRIIDAKDSIRICMAWFTDQVIMDALIKKVESGLYVDLILFDTDHNKNTQISAQGIQQLEKFKVTLNIFKDVGGNVMLIKEKKDFYLHSKFCIIDEKTTITGSYNWTYPARTHIENIVVINNKKVAGKYKTEFEKIKDKKLNLVLERSFPQCSEPNCGGNLIKMRLLNYNNTSNEYTEEYVDFEICDTDLTHITNISINSTWSLYIENIYDFEYDRLQFIQQSNDINKETLKKNINDQLASQVGSRNDLFSTHLPDEILILGTVKTVLDGYDEEETVISILWTHEITNYLVHYLPHFSEEIIEKLNE